VFDDEAVSGRSHPEAVDTHGEETDEDEEGMTQMTFVR